MTNKRIMLFVMMIIFLIIGVSAVSAVDTSGNDTVSSSDVSQNAVDNSINTQTIVKEESNVKTASESTNTGDNVVSSNNLVKNEQNIKTAPKTIVINNNNVYNYFYVQGVNVPKGYIDVNNTTMDYLWGNGLTENVTAGDVLDFQGTINQSGKVLVVDKPVNITASKGDSCIFLDTKASSMFGDEDLPSFMITKGGSYSNVSNIYLYNTQFYIKNANHIKINNITTKVENQKVGSGVGQTSIRDNSSYITVENSTFTTKDNGGSSTFVLAWATYCTIRNNKMTGIGNVGNLVYLTTYNVEGVGSENGDVYNTETINHHNVIDNNTITGPDEVASICYGIAICGSNNTVTNNKITYNGVGITTQWVTGEEGQSINTVIRNNELYGCQLYAPDGGEVVNNTIHGELILSSTAKIYNNTADSVRLSSNTVLSNNTILGNADIAPSTKNVTIANCTIDGNITIRMTTSTSSTPTNITIDNVQINGAVNLTDKTGGADNLVIKNSNITDGVYIASKRNNQVKNVLLENNIINSNDEYAVVVNKTVTNVTIKNNRLNSTDKNGNDAVYMAEGNDVTVQNNKIPQKQTQIVLNNVASSIYVNESVNITGTFKVENKASKATSITVYDNNSKIATVGPTTDNGVFTYTYKTATAGKHELLFKFAQNDTLFASQASKTITVNNPAATTITLTNSADTVYVTEKVNFNATFKAAGTAVKVNSIDVYDNNVKVATVGPSGNNGVVSYTYNATKSGSHNITFKFNGNVSHVASQASKTITVKDPETTAITLTGNSSVYYGENIVITGTFKTNNKASKVNSVDVYDNNVKVATVGPSDNNGVFNYTFKSTTLGSHNLTFKFNANVSHKACEATKSVTVNKIPTAITVVNSVDTVYVTEKVNFNATFKAENKAVKVNSIDVYDNNVKVASVGPSGNNGVVSYTYNATKSGSHNITFKFNTNASHLDSQASKTITVKDPAATTITISSDRTLLYLTEKANITGIFKENNKAIKVDSITITDNGKEVSTVGPTGTDGVFNYIFDAKEAGSHNLTFKFNGNVSHVASQESIIIEVKEPKATSISLMSNVTELYVDQNAKIDALFAFTGESTGTYVDQITVTDNKEELTKVGPSDDGKVAIEYLAKEIGTHNITFAFAGNVSHIASQASITIIVKEPDATVITLDSANDSLYLNQSANIDVVFAYQADSEGIYVDAITVSDNGVQVAVIGPADDGKLSYEYSAVEYGTHNITFEFAGNNTHAQSQESINILVKEPDATKITVNANQTEFNVTESSIITGVFAYANQDEGTYVDLITIYEDDVEIASVGPSNDGTFDYTYTPQKPGDHILTFKFAGNNTHASCQSEILYHIRGYVLKVDTTQFIEGKNATIQASIYFENEVSTDINKGKVIFKVNGKTLKDDNGKIIYAKIVNGTAKIENYLISESWTDRNITIQAISTASSQVSALKSELERLNVSKEATGLPDPVLTTEDITAKVGNTVTFKAKLTDNDKIVNEAKVVFKINGRSLKDANGKIIYAKIVNNEAVLDYEIPESWKVKDYTIQAVLLSTEYPRLVANATLKLSN